MLRVIRTRRSLGWAMLSLAAACRHPDRPTTTSETAGATTPVAVATETGSAGAVNVTPVTYESAESAYRAGNYDSATNLFSAYSRSNPENAWGFYMLGLSAWKSGDPSSALEAFDRSLALDPDHRKSLYNSSRVLLETGQPQKALERVQKALAMEPLSNEGLRLLGRTQYQLGSVTEAIEAYHRALAIDDRDVWAMNNLGVIYLEQDRSAEALPPLARAVELRGNSPVFQNNLGSALERSRHPLQAVTAYEAAIAADSSYQKASISLARVTAGNGHSEADSLDLAALSAQFQAEIEEWRRLITPADSGEIRDTANSPDSPAPDSIEAGQIGGLSDSSKASVESVPDTLEDCAQEE